ncbi:kinase-like domain-containing protein [Mycena pura]|uniref:Kinase-like domain-containing protein n=1 Tax=Mycena pura TaxID=153505 RepID=A0AAD6YUM5_9AGAR|nr:kinase-like domain-containing protein [Mycena pura]
MPDLEVPCTLCVSLDATTAGRSCGHDYPNKKEPGLCAGCTILLALAGADFDRVNAYPHCHGCGTIFNGMAYIDPPGQYLCALCSGPKLPTAAQQQQQIVRQQRMAQVGAHRPTPQALNKVKARAQGSLMGSSSASADAVMITPTCSIAVEFFLGGVVGKTKPLGIGITIEEFGLDESMEERVLVHFLGVLNHSWTLRHEHSVIQEEICLRFFGNGNMVFELAGLTIRNFITNVANSSQAKGLPSAVKTQHQKRLGVWPALQYFEFHIQSDLYTTRTNELINMGAKPSAQLKRKQDALNAALKPAKRTCMEAPSFVPVVSKFVPRTRTTSSGPRTAVKLEKIGLSINDDTAEVTINTSREPFASSPFLHDVPLAKGTMKNVYLLDDVPGGHQYVAKRFYQVEANAPPGSVCIEDNDRCITEEAQLLTQCHLFLAKFYERAKEAETLTDDLAELEYTEGFLVQEIVSDDDKPSPASGIEEDDYDEARGSGVTWLVEPFRAGTKTLKFVGTLNHKAGILQGKLAATVHAFIHFVFEYSLKTMVLVDVQAMKVADSTKVKHVLFDPMAHTTEATSGPGDHGREGIKDFLCTHSCNLKCASLKLRPLDAEDGSGSDEEEEDELFDN